MTTPELGSREMRERLATLERRLAARLQSQAAEQSAAG
jgi:hypothetical protein